MAVAKATAGVGGNPTEQAAAALAAALAAGASPAEAAAAAAAAIAASCGIPAAAAAALVAQAGPGGDAKVDPKAALRTPRTGRPDARGKAPNRGRSSSPTQKYTPHSPYYNSGDESKASSKGQVRFDDKRGKPSSKKGSKGHKSGGHGHGHGHRH